MLVLDVLGRQPQRTKKPANSDAAQRAAGCCAAAAAAAQIKPLNESLVAHQALFRSAPSAPKRASANDRRPLYPPGPTRTAEHSPPLHACAPFSSLDAQLCGAQRHPGNHFVGAVPAVWLEASAFGLQHVCDSSCRPRAGLTRRHVVHTPT